jgi:hypothetical protein
MSKERYFEVYDPNTNRYITFTFNGRDIDIAIEEDDIIKCNVIVDPTEDAEGIMDFFLDVLIEPINNGYQRRS